MHEDAELLRQYATTESEDAFSMIVRQYLPMVYAAALRRLAGDAHRAEDVTQLVFTALARNASTLTRHPNLTGWLFTTTRFLAAKALRNEHRRQSREQEAYMSQPEIIDHSLDARAALHSVLDDLMMELRQLDRQVILLRFHRGLRLAEIGAQLGATENAVQKRLDRALDRLKEKLSGRGITSTAAALAVALEQQTAIAVPAGLAVAATSAGLVGGSAGAGFAGLATFMVISKFQLGIAAAVLAASSTGFVWQYRESSRLQGEAQRQQVSAVRSINELKQQLASQSQRTATAEADLGRLLEAVQATRGPTTTARSVADTSFTNSPSSLKEGLARADQLVRRGKLQEALDEYVQLYGQLRAKRAGNPENQIVMSAMARLGRSFPPAVAALRELRDTALQQFQTNPASREAAGEFAMLNERLGEGHRTVALFDMLPVDSPVRQSFGLIANAAFVESRRYDAALVGKSFGGMINELEMGVRHSAQIPDKAGRDYVIKNAARNIEILTGGGKPVEARMLTDKLLAFDNSEATRALIKKHVERPGQSPAR